MLNALWVNLRTREVIFELILDVLKIKVCISIQACIILVNEFDQRIWFVSIKAEF